VVDIDAELGRVIVGDAEDLACESFEIDRVNWLDDRAAHEPREVVAKIRYAHPGTRARVEPLDADRARVTLAEPQRAVTPGQATVLYDGDRVIGGGWIVRHAACVSPTPA
jgi:tRNA-specific 2-thiouridylase